MASIFTSFFGILVLIAAIIGVICLIAAVVAVIIIVSAIKKKKAKAQASSDTTEEPKA